MDSGDSISFGLDMLSCKGDEECQRNKWVDQGYREESIYNDDFAKGVSGSLLAKYKMQQIAGGVAELIAIECSTATCEAYKAELLESALTSYLHLSGVVGEWAPSMDRLSLVLVGAASLSPGGVKPRPAGSPELTGAAQIEKAVEYFAKLKGAKGLLGPALPAKIADTFKGGIYTNRQLAEGANFYKYHGVDNRTGRKVSWLADKKYSSEAALRAELAIRHDWGINITSVSTFRVPKGTWVSEGAAAAQGVGYPGGGYQAVINNLPKSWVTRTDKAF